MYKAPIKDIISSLKATQPINAASVDDELAQQVFESAGVFCEKEVIPAVAAAKNNNPKLIDHEVNCAQGWRDLYAAWQSAGWAGASGDEEWGGMGLPISWNLSLYELWNSGSMAFGIGPCLTVGAAETVSAFADQTLKDMYLPKLTSGEWMGTMCLTEPESGSDLSKVRTSAVRRYDGTFSITGQKIFITYGDHDLTDNIVHLVLARSSGTSNGTKGLSLFLVPKFLPGEGDEENRRNGVRCIGLEKKFGIHASPTCTMQFGEDAGEATGWLIGEENRGLACMFTMMNAARLFVATQGVGVAERAFQMAWAYASERRQGSSPASTSTGTAEINCHPDIRRQLMEMRVQTTLARLLVCAAGQALDGSGEKDDGLLRKRGALLTPIAKFFATNVGCTVADVAIQVFGGMGYIEETGIAELLADARIAPIYEGTNGIQAIDLVTRKLPKDMNDAFDQLIDELSVDSDQCATDLPDHIQQLVRSSNNCLEYLNQAITYLRSKQNDGETTAVLASASHFARLSALCLGGAYLTRMCVENHQLHPEYVGQCEYFFVAFGPQIPSLVAQVKLLTENPDKNFEDVFPHAMGSS